MNKIQKYSINLNEYHTLLIREEDYMHKRPCDIITHRYNKIIALYNQDQNFARGFLINTKIQLAYVISGNIELVSNLVEKEVMEVSEDTMVHSPKRGDDGDRKLRKIHTDMLIGKAIQQEHAQMIIDRE